MKRKEEIEKLAERYYPPYPDGIITDEIRALREGFIKGCQCQEDKNTMIEKTALKLADAENAIRLIIKHFPKDVLADQMGRIMIISNY